MLIEWNPSIETGNKVIDDDHRHIIGILNKVWNALEESGNKFVIEDTLMEFCNHFIYHFYHEEGLMIDIKFRGYHSHKQEHRKLMNKLDRMLMDFEMCQRITPEFLRGFVQEIADHIQNFDRELAVAMKQFTPLGSELRTVEMERRH